ncbi:MAG: acyltransferase [bacterium]|nr:MAG: acyltransferase [bacterium]
MTAGNSNRGTLPDRLYELDWIRVLVTIDLIPFHVAWMITSIEGFSFVERGTVAWYILNCYVRFVSPLHMFLLFLVAGTSTFMALRYRVAKQYVGERIQRLLIPLLMFMIFLFPVLGYFWPPAIFLGAINYWTQFWPGCLKTTFYSHVTGGPNWAHMWFVAYLFIYSLILLPVLIRIRAGKSPLIEYVTRFLTNRRGAIFLIGIPLTLTFALLSPIWPFFRNNLYSDWGYFTYNLMAFFLGFMIARDQRFATAFDRHTAVSFALGILFSAVKIFMEYRLPSFSTPAYTMRYTLYSLVAGFNTAFWIVAALSIARRALRFTNRFLGYLSRISYPFYIFHLVIIPVAGHYIASLRWGIIAEFALICTVSLTGSIVCCELVKRTPVTRFLLGIKEKRPASR